MKAENIDFPCLICGTPAKVDRINGICQTCRRRTCASCARRCGRCVRTFCENDVEERTVMIQQAEHHMLLCSLCRLVLLLWRNMCCARILNAVAHWKKDRISVITATHHRQHFLGALQPTKLKDLCSDTQKTVPNSDYHLQPPLMHSMELLGAGRRAYHESLQLMQKTRASKYLSWISKANGRT